jgi:hypothetical protein
MHPQPASLLPLLAWLLAACSAPAPQSILAPAPATPSAAPVASAPVAAAETGAWLAWRQDVGGVVRIALVERSQPDAPVAVTRAPRLLLAGAGVAGAFRLWDVGPATTRWSVSPCGEHALAFAKGLRVAPAFGGSAGGGHLDVSDPGLRPAAEANAIHREFTVFTGQTEAALVVRHVTRSGPCPLGAGAETVTELTVDLATGVMTPAAPRASTPEGARLAARRAAAPTPVAELWAELARLDEGREVEPDEAGLYGGVGWVAVPPADVARVRDLIAATRDAPTPSGPTDWD